MKGPCLPLLGLLVALGGVSSAAGQIPDPKAGFVQALARFNRALEGTYGDEGRAVTASLDDMERGLDQWDAAIRTYEAAVAAESRAAAPRDAAGMHLALAAVYLDRSRADPALRELASAHDLDPARADVPTLQGLTHSQLSGDQSAATRSFQEALALDPADPVRQYVLADHLRRIGDHDGFERMLQRLHKGQLAGLVEPGRAALDAPFFRLRLLPESTGVEPYFAPALYSEGFDLIARGDYKAALARLRDAAAHDPLVQASGPDGRALSDAAVAFRDGRAADAVASLKSAIDLAPQHAEPHRILGWAYVADQQYDAGVDELRKAAALDPRDERARLTLAEVLADMRQYQAAEDVLRQTIEVLPASGGAHYRLARLYHWQGLESAALGEFEKAVTFKPMLGANSIFQTMGGLYAAQHNFEAAIGAYARRIDVAPNDAGAHDDLGDIYFREGADDAALGEFAVALLLDPRQAAAHAAVAQTHLRAGRYAECVTAAERALQLDPSLTQARYALGSALMRVGRTDEGRQQLQTYEQLQAEATAARSRKFEVDALKREASVSSAKGDYPEVVRLLRRALEYERNVAAAHFSLGVALLNAGQPAEAIERFRSAEILGDHFDVHRRLAEAYAAVGETEQSQKQQVIFERMKRESLREAGRQDQ